MDLEELIRYRTWIGVAVAVALLIGWYAYGYRPRSERIRSLESREEAIAQDRAQVSALARRSGSIQEYVGGRPPELLSRQHHQARQRARALLLHRHAAAAGLGPGIRGDSVLDLGRGELCGARRLSLSARI